MGNFIHPFISDIMPSGEYELSIDNDPDSVNYHAELTQHEAEVFNEVLKKFAANESPTGPFAPHIIFTRRRGK